MALSKRISSLGWAASWFAVVASLVFLAGNGSWAQSLREPPVISNEILKRPAGSLGAKLSSVDKSTVINSTTTSKTTSVSQISKPKRKNNNNSNNKTRKGERRKESSGFNCEYERGDWQECQNGKLIDFSKISKPLTFGSFFPCLFFSLSILTIELTLKIK